VASLRHDSQPMRGTIWKTYDSMRTSSSSSVQCFDIETKPISVIRSDDVHHTLQVADSIFKFKTRSLLFRPLDRRSPNQECKDTIHQYFFFYKTLFYILLVRPVTWKSSPRKPTFLSRLPQRLPLPHWTVVSYKRRCSPRRS